MESEKLEDLLLLSLSASKGQRERSEVLDVGVTRDKNLREVIVNCKASGGSDRSARGCPGDRICGDAEKSADRFV